MKITDGMKIKIWLVVSKKSIAEFAEMMGLSKTRISEFIAKETIGNDNKNKILDVTRGSLDMGSKKWAEFENFFAPTSPLNPEVATEPVKLMGGRPRGNSGKCSDNRKKLNDNADDIMALINAGTKRIYIAEKYGVGKDMLCRFVNERLKK